MEGYWKDGTPLTYGGNGYGGTTTKFAFSGSPQNGTGWYEDTLNGCLPGDRRGVATVGPFNFAPGDNICLEIAFPFVWDYDGTRLTSLNVLNQRVQSVKSFFTSQNFNCLQTPYNVPLLAKDNGNLQILPNPSNGLFTMHKNDFQSPLSVKIFNIIGRCVYEKKILTNNEQIDISDQPSGIYFYKVNDKNYQYSGKLLIQK